ncbi:MAG: glycoside hydrolase family 127 protein [Bacteroidales bacterium]|nr:glycoside hydrolase family 127 protein [Bacteroidales bacterium]
MKIRMLIPFAAALFISAVASSQTFNRTPLEATEYAELPIGAIKARGWLLDQLQRQASGLTGRLDEVYPEVMGPDNAWLGGSGDAWERGPYWIDGLLPLAWILDDDNLKAKAQAWVEAILASVDENGFIGPQEDHPFVYGLQRGKAHDWWPRMVALKILKQYYLATADTRVLECLSAYFRYQLDALKKYPLDHWSDWGAWRGADNLDIVYWVYNLTGEPWLLELGELIHSQTRDWTSMFRSGSIFTTQNDIHCVNLGQGFKAPVVWWQYSHSAEDLLAPAQAVETIRHTVGLPTGLWAGDELLHFGDPARGSELCTAVEMMYSLETMLRITGNVSWADYLEIVAFNALPTQATDDFGYKQYYQQANQVSCKQDWRPFSTPHGGTDVLFGTLNGYPCCLSNMHQGWPKFTRNLWYATPDGGLAALVYAPSTVRSRVAAGVEAVITEETDYPFRETVNFSIDLVKLKLCSASFPLRFRVPGWCKEPSVKLNGKPLSVTPQDGIILIRRSWQTGDRVELAFPMPLQTEEWYDRSWSVVRGPLVYALRMDEHWSWKSFTGTDRWYGDGAWEVTSDSPWNFCLMRDSFSTENCVVDVRTVDGYPWNIDNAPVVINVPARTLPFWKEPSDVAYFSESGYDIGGEVRIDLIPYGCTTLRISCFPTRVVPWDLEYRNILR